MCATRHGQPAVVAVDGGNTKTDVVVLDDTGELLGSAHGGASCHQIVGMDTAIETIDTVLSEALRSAGVPDARPAAAVGVYCLAGMDLPVDERRLGEAIAAARWSERDVLHNDTVAVLRAGASAGWGVGIVCGAGVNCAGLGPDGRTVRFPALGELSGDFTTGGTWLGTRALGLALRARDGRGEPTCLESRVPAHYQMASPEEVLEAVYTGTLGFDRLPELAELVLDAAADGDPVARSTVDVLVDEILALARATIRRLALEGSAVEVVFGGGVFSTRDEGFHRRVRDGITALAPKARFRALDAPPVVGAALLGCDALGLPASAERRVRAALGGDAPGIAG